MNKLSDKHSGIFDPSLRRCLIRRRYPYRRPVELLLVFWLALAAPAGWFVGAITCDDEPADFVVSLLQPHDHGEHNHREQRHGSHQDVEAQHTVRDSGHLFSGQHLDELEDCCTFFLSADSALFKQQRAKAHVASVRHELPPLQMLIALWNNYVPTVADVPASVPPGERGTHLNRKIKLLI